jgi:O-antigen/teichoic acid export membrane protein
MKVFLFVFAGIAALYAASLEWVAWGKEQLWLVGWSKAVVPISILMFLAAGSLHGQSIFRWAIAGNAAGYILQSILFWIWWRRHRTDEEGTAEDRDAIRDALAWRRTSVMGLAWFSNLAFVSVDMLMLGLLANAEQVGLYSAAYRVLNQVLVTYYLFVNALYPRFAQHSLKQRLAMLRVHILLPLFGVGVAVAALVTVFRRPVLTVLFGQGFVASAPLLLVLACAIPVDFLVSYLSSAYIAWSMERHMLKCALLAAGTDVVLNLYGIPRYGAMAAAVNTVISYLVYLAALSFVARRVSRAGDTLPQTA